MASIIPTKVQRIMDDLGENYLNDEPLLEDIYNEISLVASNISNIDSEDDRLYPHIKKAVKAEYLARGAEGLKSRSEGSISSTYEAIIETLEKDLIRSGLRRVF